MNRILPVLFFFLPLLAHAQKEFMLDTFNLHVASSFRGLSVVTDKIIWVSGSNGYVCKTQDGGQTWDTLRISGYENSDLRDIEGFDDRNAIVMASGSPAVLLRTNDGGIKWKLVYRNDDARVFLNGMDFWDAKRGIAYSDPLDGKLFLVATLNGGSSWKEVPFRDAPQVQESEAGFAASGTSIRVAGDGFAFIGTGGRAAHLFTSEDFGKSWKKFSCPILKGKESTGVFSLAFKDARTGIIVGGDYKMDTLSTDNCFLTYNGGKTWKAPLAGPKGYRSCVDYITQTSLVCTGPGGTDFSRDGGNTWKRISSSGFHVVRKAKAGSRIFLAGENGRFGMLMQY